MADLDWLDNALQRHDDAAARYQHGSRIRDREMASAFDALVKGN